MAITVISTYPPEVVETRNRLNEILSYIDDCTMKDLRGPLDPVAFQKRIDQRNTEAQPILDQLTRLEETLVSRKVVIDDA